MKKNYQEKMIVQEWMLNALLDLMRKTPYEKITISQIAEKAGVPRMTYYRNYKAKEDVLKRYSEYLTEELAHIFRKSKHKNDRESLRAQVDFFLQHKKYLQVLVQCHKEYIILDTINRNIDSMGFETKEAIVIRYCAGGIYNILFSWLRNEENSDLDTLLETTFQLIDPTVLERAIGEYIRSFTKYE